MKIYAVTFNQHINSSNDAVSKVDPENRKSSLYLSIGNQPFLITEDQIEQIREYGYGIKSLVFVGNLWDMDRPYLIQRV